MSDAGEAASGRRVSKRAAVFRTIGEVADDLDLPAHVLRFWESKFPQLKPLKRGGGRRYYRPEDIALLSRIRQCLYQDGYTIRGVQKLLTEGALDVNGGPDPTEPSLFPLAPAPMPGREAPRPARSARRAVESEVAPASSPSPAQRAALVEAQRELTAALEMLGELVRLRS